MHHSIKVKLINSISANELRLPTSNHQHVTFPFCSIFSKIVRKVWKTFSISGDSENSIETERDTDPILIFMVGYIGVNYVRKNYSLE